MSDKTVADGLLAQLAGHVDYLFANPGTDFPPIIEAIAKASADGTPTPRVIGVPHENLAVAMAYGHTMVSGRPQAIMVHVNVGTANALCNLINAAKDRIPMLLAAGRTPILEAGADGARSRVIHWAQEMFDQAGMVREAVKWDYELRRPEQLETIVNRAFDLATSEPAGPVYLTLPREVLAAPWSGTEPVPSHPRAAPMAAHADAIAAAADILAAADKPLIITSGVGRDPAAVAALGDLAERFALPVVSFFARHVCLPGDHPMYLGHDPGPLLQYADAVLVLDCDVPWIPSLQAPPETCRVIHLGVDPLFAGYPVRGFAGELAIPADPVQALPALTVALAERGAGRGDAIAQRRAALARMRDEEAAARQEAVDALSSAKPIHPIWVSRCIDAVKDDESIVINELGLAPAHLSFGRPGTYFAASPAGGLGWGLGAALGAKLAAPDRFVIAAVGDGSYMFGNPTPAHYMAAAHDLPVLFVVCNNSGWGAVTAATQAMYPEGRALKQTRPPLTATEPSPAYEKIIEASGGHGVRVDDPADLPAALAEAARVVREDRRQALVNVITQDR